MIIIVMLLRITTKLFVWLGRNTVCYLVFEYKILQFPGWKAKAINHFNFYWSKLLLV